MGIDLERFPGVNPELICSICAGVLENPVELPCRHVFCSPCISRWLDTNHSCPICRTEVQLRDLKPALPLLRNIIGKLKIRCDFVHHGCTEIVELERLGAHTRLCPFAPMTCENEGCEVTFLRRSKADHEAECPQRVIFCSSTSSQSCGLQLRLSELPGHSCVKSLKSRVEELEQTVSDYSQRILTLEGTVNELRRQQETDQLYAEYSQRSGLADALRHSEANRQLDVDSGLISLLSGDEESESRSSSPIDAGFGGMTPTHTLSLTTVELAGTLMTGQREFRRQRSLRQSPPHRQRSRSRSPLRQNESQDGTSRRYRESSPSESSCTRRTTRRPRRPKPFTPSSPSASSTSTNNCGHSDSPVVESRERRHSRPLVIDDSSSEDTPHITGEIRHNVTGTEVLEFDRIPERAVFFTPPGSTEASAYFGDRQVHQWLQQAIEESPSSSNSNNTGSRSPLRQNESQDGTSRRYRESLPSESSCTRRTTYRPYRRKPFTPSSPSTSSTSTNNCGHSDSPVVESRESRHSRPLVIDDSSSEDTPHITGEIRHHVTGTEVLEFDRIPERAVFFTPPGSTEASAYFGDRQVHQWLQQAIEESPSSSNSNNTGSNSSSTNGRSSPPPSC